MTALEYIRETTVVDIVRDVAATAFIAGAGAGLVVAIIQHLAEMAS